jgi:hypothetical protein
MIYGLEGFNKGYLKEAIVNYIDFIATSFPKIKERLFYFGFRNEINQDCINALVNNGNFWEEDNKKNSDIAYYEIKNGLDGGTEEREEEIACTIRLRGKGNDLILFREKAFDGLDIETIEDEVIKKEDSIYLHSGLQKTTLQHIIAHELGHVILEDYFEGSNLTPYVLFSEGNKIKYEPASENNKDITRYINNTEESEKDRKALLKLRAANVLAFYSMSKGQGECGLYSKTDLVKSGNLKEWMAETISAHFAGGAMDNYMKTFMKILYKNRCLN